MAEGPVGMVLCSPCPALDVIRGMQLPVGAAQVGCVTQLPPCPSGATLALCWQCTDLGLLPKVLV